MPQYVQDHDPYLAATDHDHCILLGSAVGGEVSSDGAGRTSSSFLASVPEVRAFSDERSHVNVFSVSRCLPKHVFRLT